MIDTMQMLTNVLLCVMLGAWHWWRRNKGMDARLNGYAMDAVHRVRTSYTRPIMQQRVQCLASDGALFARAGQRADVLRVSYQAARLTSEEKKEARQQAINHLRRAIPGSMCRCLNDAQLGQLVDKAHRGLPSLLASTLTETACVMQLLGCEGDRDSMPGTPDVSMWHHSSNVSVTGDEKV